MTSSRQREFAAPLITNGLNTHADGQTTSGYHHVVTRADQVAERLRTAKRCTSRGRAQLSGSPWKSHFHGHWLVIDLPGAHASPSVGLASLGVVFIALVQVQSFDTIELLVANFADVVAVSAVVTITADHLKMFVKKRDRYWYP